MSDSSQSYSVQAASAFDPRVGLNVSADTPAATLLAELSALGVGSVRATLTTAAEAGTLETLGAHGIALDLVLAPEQSVASLVALARQVDSAAPNSVAFLEGPDLVADPGYTYTRPATGAVLSGDAAGDQATADLISAASSGGLGGVATIDDSTSVAATATAKASPTYLDINPGDVALSDPADALSAAQDDATIGATAPNPHYVVANIGGSAPATLLDGLLDAQFRFGFSSTASTSGTGTAAVTTYATVLPPTFLAAASGAPSSPTSLYDAGALTASGAAFVNLGSLIASGTGGASAGGTLSLGVAPYEQGVQYDENVEVFAGPGGSADILLWGDEEAPSASGHGPSVVQFGMVQALVQVFDPTQGTTAVATFSNLSELDIANSPDGPLVIRVSDAATSASGTIGTYAGVVSAGGTGTTGTSGGGTGTTGTSTGGTGTAGSGTSTGGTSATGTGTGGTGSTGTGSTGTGTGSTGTGTGSTGTGTSSTGTSSTGTSSTGTTGTNTGTNTGVVSTGTSSTGTITGVTSTAGASGTTFVTPASGSSSVAASAAGNDVINSQGTDTISAGGGTDVVYASGPAATVLGGAGALVFIAGAGTYNAGGGAGADTLYGGSGSDTLTGGAATNSILVAGSGNTTLSGGAGSAAVMFGGPASNSFLGGAGGGDTMVGGTGANVFAMASGDVAFGGPNSSDTFYTGNGNALIVEGNGAEHVVLGSGVSIVFAGSGPDTYSVTRGLAAQAGIIGFKSGDHLALSGGYTAPQVSAALSAAATGSFGTILTLPDGTTITLYGASLSAAQISTA